MSTVEKFSPSIVIDGKVIHPPGWVYVLAYAVAGCEWAIKEVETPEFKAIVKQYRDERHNNEVLAEIDALEKRLAKLKASIIH